MTPLFAACGSQKTDVKDGNQLKGTIATNLTNEEKVLESVMGRLLRAFQGGVRDADDLAFTAWDIELNGGVPGFYEGHKRLYRWDFVGAPKGNAIAVSLVFDEQESGSLDKKTQKTEERVYAVQRSGTGFSVKRNL